MELMHHFIENTMLGGVKVASIGSRLLKTNGYCSVGMVEIPGCLGI